MVCSSLGSLSRLELSSGVSAAAGGSRWLTFSTSAYRGQPCAGRFQGEKTCFSASTKVLSDLGSRLVSGTDCAAIYWACRAPPRDMKEMSDSCSSEHSLVEKFGLISVN